MEFKTTAALMMPLQGKVKRGALKAAPLFLFLALVAGCKGYTPGRLAMKIPLGDGVRAIALSPKSPQAVIAGSKHLYFVDFSTQPPSVKFLKSDYPLSAIAFCNSGDSIVAYEKTEQRLLEIDIEHLRIKRYRNVIEDGEVTRLFFDQTNGLLVLGFKDKAQLGIYSYETLRRLKDVVIPGNTLKMMLNPAGDLMVLTSEADSLSKIRLIDRRYVSSGLAQYRPTGFDVDTQGGVIWVSADGNSAVSNRKAGTLIAFGADDSNPQDQLNLPWIPGEIALWRDGFAVLEKKGTRLHFLDFKGKLLSTLDLGAYTGEMVFDSDSNRLLITLPSEGSLLLVAPPSLRKGEDAISSIKREFH